MIMFMMVMLIYDNDNDIYNDDDDNDNDVYNDDDDNNNDENCLGKLIGYILYVLSYRISIIFSAWFLYKMVAHFNMGGG